MGYQPHWQPFPLLEVRVDVLVVGPVRSMALVKLARLVLRDAADMTASGHYMQAMVLQVNSDDLCMFACPVASSKCDQKLL